MSDFGCGSFEMTPGVKNPRIEPGFSDALWSLRTVPITPPCSDDVAIHSAPWIRKSSVAKLTAPVGIHRVAAAYRKISSTGCGEKFSRK